MNRLHTLEEHRRRSYATLLTRYLLFNKTSGTGRPLALRPQLHIIVDNTASEQFFQRMGFRFQYLDYIHTKFNH